MKISRWLTILALALFLGGADALAKDCDPRIVQAGLNRKMPELQGVSIEWYVVAHNKKTDNSYVFAHLAENDALSFMTIPLGSYCRPLVDLIRIDSVEVLETELVNPDVEVNARAWQEVIRIGNRLRR